MDASQPIPVLLGNSKPDGHVDAESVPAKTDVTECSAVARGTSEDDCLGTVTVPGQVFNVIKSVVGEGMLSLPAAMSKGTGIIPAIIMTGVASQVFMYTFSMIGRVAHATNEKRFNEMGTLVGRPWFGKAIALVCMLKTVMTSLAFSIAISELGQDIFKAFGAEGFIVTRQVVLVLFTLTVITPLCLVKDLSKLSITSFIGVFCEVGVIVFMTVRFADGSYAKGGTYYLDLDEKFRPEFPDEDSLWRVHITTAILLDSMTTAFIAHYNAPKFYYTLKDRSVKRFNLVVTISFCVAAVLYIWAMLVGYWTFGTDCNGLILNNYSHNDEWATVARCAILFAVLFAYPLVFTGLRDHTINLLGKTSEAVDLKWFFGVTAAWLLIVLTITLFLDDLGIVNSLGGAILGSFITLIFPGLLAYLTYQRTPKKFFKSERCLFAVVIVVGSLVLVFGGSIAVIEKATTWLE